MINTHATVTGCRRHSDHRTRNSADCERRAGLARTCNLNNGNNKQQG